ncbi:MAG: tRNA-dihydrouridine synthase family protein [Phycisphaerales bacterium]
MGCDGNNATPPSPAIAPGAGEIDPRRVAQSLVERFGEGGMDPRVRAVVPDFDAPFFQAGLAGYSDAAMRIIARRHGAPYCVTEALLDRTLLAGGRGFAKADLGEIEDNIPGGGEDHPLAGQIMGSEPSEMAAAAIKMVEQAARREKEYRGLAEGGSDVATKRRSDEGAGASPGESARRNPSVAPSLRRFVASSPAFAAIDVNLACPVKKIAKKARGGHWLSEPAGAVRILEAVREAVPKEIAVTVKMRRAFDETDQMRENFLRLFDAAYDIGCAWVTVHGRTVTQKYIGPSRWDPIRELVHRNPERVIFGSGDVWRVEDIFRMLAYCSSDSRRGGLPAHPSRDAPRLAGVSVARGCIGNPWIFRQAREILAGRETQAPTLIEQRETLLQHFQLAMDVNRLWVRGDDEAREVRAEQHTARTMRKFAIRFAEHHPDGEAVRKRFIACRSLEEWRGVLDEHYAAEAMAR